MRKLQNQLKMQPCILPNVVNTLRVFNLVKKTCVFIKPIFIFNVVAHVLQGLPKLWNPIP